MTTTHTHEPLQTDESPLEPLPTPSRAAHEQRAKDKPPVVRGPSGATFRLRKVSLERHALSGGLPTNLRRAAMEGVKGLERLLEQDLGGGEGGGDEGKTSETRDYLDSLVLATIVEPKFTKADLGTGDLDEDPVLHPLDYQWAVKVAMGEDEYDADGRRLWGLEPLDRFATFRAFHGCDADCEGCDGFRTAVSAYVSRGRGAGQ